MKNSRWLAISALTMLVGLNAVLTGAPADPTGAWQGRLIRSDRSWTVRFAVWPESNGTRACLDFPDYGLYYRCTTDVTVADTSVRMRFVSGRDAVTFEGTLVDDRYVGSWTGLGLEAAFELTRTGDAPAPLIEEPVKFRNGDVELAGTLVRPLAHRRLAAVVWTHGSGNQRRTEDFYRDRGYLLAQNGIAALVYDKRGVGESTGDAESTLDELAGDAVAAVQFLQARSDIDPSLVGIGGFSQGGFVAPLAASRYGRIAFVLTGATPGVSPAELNDYAARTALGRRGFAADVIDRAMGLRGEVLRAQQTGEGLAGLDGKLAAVRREPWFAVAELPRGPVQQYGRRGLSVINFDPVPVWQRVRVPVLAMWGEDDALVPVEPSRRAIAAALREARNTQVTMRVFPAAGHGLAVTSRPNAWDWPRLTPGFHDFMLQWVLARTVPRGST